jgi:hypothetical protein
MVRCAMNNNSIQIGQSEIQYRRFRKSLIIIGGFILFSHILSVAIFISLFYLIRKINQNSIILLLLLGIAIISTFFFSLKFIITASYLHKQIITANGIYCGYPKKNTNNPILSFINIPKKPITYFYAMSEIEQITFDEPVENFPSFSIIFSDGNIEYFISQNLTRSDSGCGDVVERLKNIFKDYYYAKRHSM